MFLRFPVELRFHQRLSTPVLSSRFSVLSENRLESLPVAALRANAAVANYFEIVLSVPSQFLRIPY
jgi:hypothetical protein